MPKRRSRPGGRFHGATIVPAAATAALLAAAAYPALSAPVAADTPAVTAAPLYPVHVVLKRMLDTPAPTEADAIRVSVLGDGSGARVQFRLLAAGNASPAIDAYYASPDITLDFKGWKTVTLPFSDFTYRSEQNPETDAASTNVSGAISTVDMIQVIVSTAPACKVFFDDLAWVKASSAPTDAPLVVIDDFEKPFPVIVPGKPVSTASWQPGGDYDQIRATTISQTSVAAYVKSGQGAMQVVVQSSGFADNQLYGPTLSAKLKSTPTLPYALFVRPTFEAIRPNSTPSPKELLTPPALKVFACAGQIEPVSFSVYSAVDLKDATVKVVGPFPSVSKQSSLPPSAIDVRVVRLGDGSTPTDSYAPVPELLMKDDRESLEGALPTVRLTGDPTTTVPAGTTKQFWVTVNVPKSQFAAIYTGKLVFSAPGMKPTAIPLQVEVVPMTIKTAFLQYGIDLHSRLSAQGGGPADDVVVTPDTYAAELADVRDHGFRIVTIDEPLETLPQALTLYKSAGLSPVGPIILRTPLHTKEEVKQVDAMRDSVGLGSEFDIYYQMPDDLMAQCVSPALASSGATSAAAIPEPLKEYMKALKTGSRKPPLVVAPCVSRSTYLALGNMLDNSTLAPIFASTSDYTTTLLTTGKREIANRDYWSWNIARQSPAHNRMLSGLLLCKTGVNSSPLYGAFAGPYQGSVASSGGGSNPLTSAPAVNTPAFTAPAPATPAPTPAPGGTEISSLTADTNTNPATQPAGLPAPVPATPTPGVAPAQPGTPALDPTPAAPAPAAAGPIGPTIGGDHVAYLVNGGVIDTIQWEAVRAGVDDVRYYGALKGYIRDLKDNKIRKDATDMSEAYLAAIMKKPFRSLSPEQYQAMRRGIADQAVKLLTILRSKIGGYPG